MADEKIYINTIVIKEGLFPDSLDVWIPNIEKLFDDLSKHVNFNGGINLRIGKKKYQVENKSSHYVTVNTYKPATPGNSSPASPPADDEDLPF